MYVEQEDVQGKREGVWGEVVMEGEREGWRRVEKGGCRRRVAEGCSRSVGEGVGEGCSRRMWQKGVGEGCIRRE